MKSMRDPLPGIVDAFLKAAIVPLQLGFGEPGALGQQLAARSRRAALSEQLEHGLADAGGLGVGGGIVSKNMPSPAGTLAFSGKTDTFRPVAEPVAGLLRLSWALTRRGIRTQVTRRLPESGGDTAAAWKGRRSQALAAIWAACRSPR